jgi:ABC-type multidrug transport system fused ATPase/permease subunit
MHPRSSVARLQSFLRPYRGEILIAMAVALLASVAALSVPWFGRWALDGIASSLAPEDVNDGFLVLGGLWLVAVMLAFLRDLLSSRLGHRITSDLRAEIVGHSLRLPLAYYDRHRVGELMSKLTGDSEQLRRVLADDLVRVVGDIAMVLGGGVLLLILDWKLTAALLAVGIAAPFIHRRLSPQLRSLNRTALDALSAALSRVSEALSNLRLVKAFEREAHETLLARQAVSRVFEAAVRASRFELFVWTGVYASFGLIALAVIWYGVHDVVSGRMSLGSMIAYFYTIVIIAAPATSVASATARFQRAHATADRIYEILDAPQEKEDTSATGELRVSLGEIEFTRVAFAYTPGQPILTDFSLNIPAAKTTALVGATGSGKSTVLSLLQRLYELDAGEIRVDGTSIHGVTRRSLRQAFALVPQEVLLFDDTILENIRYGRLDASDAEVKHVALATHVDRYARGLEAGLETMIGERGVRLSGGQRQLIAIARALLRDAPILLLDEPTSALDAQFEACVHDALRTLMAGRTTLVIAHQPRTIAAADRIAVLDRGRIVATGTYTELIRDNDLFRELFMSGVPTRQDGEPAFSAMR